MAIGQTLGSITYFSVLVVLFMTICSLLGMELFAYRIRFDENGDVSSDVINGSSPRLNFDTFLNGLITVFVLLTSEDWNAVTYDHNRGLNSWLPAIYFVFVVILGFFILLNLFLAILIYNFGEASKETKEKIILENLESNF